MIGVNTYGSIFTKITDSMNTWIKKNTDGAEDINLNFFHNCDCGRENEDEEGINIVPISFNRILYPTRLPRNSHAYPWMALVVRDAQHGFNPANRKADTYCGGSVITSKEDF